VSEPVPSNLFAGALDLLAAKCLEDEAGLGIAFPYVTGPDGRWLTMLASESAGYSGSHWSHGNWFCGFWVGLLLMAHLRTGKRRLLDLARERFRLVAQRASDPNTHDIGFIFLSSSLPALHITGETHFAEVALRAAVRLRARLVRTERGGYISSWGPHSDPRGRASSAIDTMANLPLLYWAAAHTGDESFLVAGELHARATIEAFVRADDSTCHAVEYALPSGSRVRAFTFQGHADGSFWSRGQAWAILGLAETARATRDASYLGLAHRLVDRFLTKQGEETAAAWDFADPAGGRATRDSSASAIVANALLELAALEPNIVLAERRHNEAVSLLERLCRAHLASDTAQRGLLRNGCYAKPQGIGTDAAVLFGDYYFAEALLRILSPGAFRALPERLISTGRVVR